MTKRSDIVKSSTVNLQEVEKFSELAEQWWDPNGEFKMLHVINPVRIEYILQNIRNHFKQKNELKILDIGCGGGIAAIALAQHGFAVTGVDASKRNISVAEVQRKRLKLRNISFIASTVEELALTKQNSFDVICALEVIEHVENVELFLQSAWSMLKPGGLLFVSTINRTFKSLLLAKIGAEYILRCIPKGTHSWEKFLKPSEIITALQAQVQVQQSKVQRVQAGGQLAQAVVRDISGMQLNPITNTWRMSKDVAVNYIMTIMK